ncbi:MAG: NTP transferase domain-containing protein [Planctomycetes bacterium]|nr:NTP transferase domain-containing protein [Planctomycetota bacterium]
MMSESVAVILAAGQSRRMKTKLAKVMHEVCGRPMLSYVVDACRTAGVGKIIIVVGYGKEQIVERFGGCSDIVFSEQAEQKGTGHAVMCCKEHLAGFSGQVLILCGDAPLVRSEMIATLMEQHLADKAAVTLATTVMDDPFGYGRIARDSDGNIQGIVEHNDCSEEQLGITEINPGYFCFDNKVLLEVLDEIKPDNAKGEYYLTDALHIALAKGYKATAVTAVAAEDAMGVNNRVQLSEASSIMRHRILALLMDNGVTIVDPGNTWIDNRVVIGQDTVIEPFTYIHGATCIGKNCRIGPFGYLRDAAIEDGTERKN